MNDHILIRDLHHILICGLADGDVDRALAQVEEAANAAARRWSRLKDNEVLIERERTEQEAHKARRSELKLELERLRVSRPS